MEGNLCLAVVSMDSAGKPPLMESFCICSIPRPAYGGRDCPGSSFDYQMCNTEECAGPYEDFRAQQCIQRSNKYHNNIKHTWIPYEHPDGGCRASPIRRRLWRTLERPGSSNRLFFFSFTEARKCELSCRSKETGEVVFMNQVMHDGTRCSYSDPFSVCARGECLVSHLSFSRAGKRII